MGTGRRENLEASLSKSCTRVPGHEEFRRRIDTDPAGLVVSILPAIRSIIRILLHTRGIQPRSFSLDDLVQGMALVLLQRGCRMIKTYDPVRSSPVTWLTLLVGINLPHVLRLYMDCPRPRCESQRLGDIAAPRDSAENSLLARERLSLLDRAAALLDARDRQLLEALRRFDFSADQTALHLGISRNQLYRRKNRLILRLRAIVMAAAKQSVRNTERSSPRAGEDVCGHALKERHSARQGLINASGSTRSAIGFGHEEHASTRL